MYISIDLFFLLKQSKYVHLCILLLIFYLSFYRQYEVNILMHYFIDFFIINTNKYAYLCLLLFTLSPLIKIKHAYSCILLLTLYPLIQSKYAYLCILLLTLSIKKNQSLVLLSFYLIFFIKNKDRYIVYLIFFYKNKVNNQYF